jgi:capsule polysaccharide export protein KpsE/RkpR
MDQSASPPLPPDVRRQQQPALAQFAEGAMKKKKGQPGQQESPEQQQGPTGLQLVTKNITDIAKMMTEMAQVLNVEKPALMPLLVRGAGVMKQLEEQVQQASSQGQGSPMTAESGPSQAADAAEGPQSISA